VRIEIMKTVLTVIAVCALLGSVLVGWKRSPPPIYQRFKFEYWCSAAENTGYTIRIVQYTTENYTRHVPSGVTLNERAPSDTDIKILPPTAVAQQFMRQNNLVAYYFEAKKKNGQVCWKRLLTQVELDELNAEWARMNPRDPDRVAVIRVGEACCR
jgi:hypothetical protein